MSAHTGDGETSEMTALRVKSSRPRYTFFLVWILLSSLLVPLACGQGAHEGGLDGADLRGLAEVAPTDLAGDLEIQDAALDDGVGPDASGNDFTAFDAEDVLVSQEGTFSLTLLSKGPDHGAVLTLDDSVRFESDGTPVPGLLLCSSPSCSALLSNEVLSSMKAQALALPPGAVDLRPGGICGSERHTHTLRVGDASAQREVVFCAGDVVPEELAALLGMLNERLSASCGARYGVPLSYAQGGATSAAEDALRLTLRAEDASVDLPLLPCAPDGTLAVVADGHLQLPGLDGCSLRSDADRLLAGLRTIEVWPSDDVEPDEEPLFVDALPGLPRYVLEASFPAEDGSMEHHRVAYGLVEQEWRHDPVLLDVLRDLHRNIVSASSSSPPIRPFVIGEDVIAPPIITVETTRADGRRELFGYGGLVMWFHARGGREWRAWNEQAGDPIRLFDTTNLLVYDLPPDDVAPMRELAAGVDWQAAAQAAPPSCPPDATVHSFQVRTAVADADAQALRFALCGPVDEGQPALRALLDGFVRLRARMPGWGAFLPDFWHPFSKSAGLDASPEPALPASGSPATLLDTRRWGAGGGSAFSLQLRSHAVRIGQDALLYLEAPTHAYREGGADPARGGGLLVTSEPPCVASLQPAQVDALVETVAELVPALPRGNHRPPNGCESGWGHELGIRSSLSGEAVDELSLSFCGEAPPDELVEALVERVAAVVGEACATAAPAYLVGEQWPTQSDPRGFAAHVQAPSVGGSHVYVEDGSLYVGSLSPCYIPLPDAGAGLYAAALAHSWPPEFTEVPAWCTDLPGMTVQVGHYGLPDGAAGEAEPPLQAIVGLCMVEREDRVAPGLLEFLTRLQRALLLNTTFSGSLLPILLPASDEQGRDDGGWPLASPAFFVDTDGGGLQLNEQHGYANGVFWRSNNARVSGGNGPWPVPDPCRVELSLEDRQSLEQACMAVDWEQLGPGPLGVSTLGGRAHTINVWPTTSDETEPSPHQLVVSELWAEPDPGLAHLFAEIERIRDSYCLGWTPF